jgi:hypothetical protein
MSQGLTEARKPHTLQLRFDIDKFVTVWALIDDRLHGLSRRRSCALRGLDRRPSRSRRRSELVGFQAEKRAGCKQVRFGGGLRSPCF